MAEQNFSGRASSVSLGTTVVVLYFFFVSVVAMGFGTYIFRTSWQAEVSQTATQAAQISSIDNMLFILGQEKALERETEQLNMRLSALEAERTIRRAEVKQSFADISRAKEAVSIQAHYVLADLHEIKGMLGGVDVKKFDAVANDDYLTPVKRTNALLALFSSTTAPSSVDAETAARYESIRLRSQTRWDELNGAVQRANSGSHAVQAELTRVTETIDALIADQKAQRDTILALQEKLPLGSQERARLSALSLSIPIMPDLLLRWVSFPTIFLTLIVTIAAGGLGTVVAFSRRYYSSRDASGLSLSRLFVNVGEGIAAAIAIFLFSGAGMLALTQGGGGSTGGVELSPYTVAFVAFLSGFMAEDAFAAIQAAGKRIFSKEAQAAK